jgi:hypothetical protein
MWKRRPDHGHADQPQGANEAGHGRQRHGWRAHLEELLKIAPDLYDITVFGAEPHPNYNRILLSPVLAGEQTLDEIVLNDWDWYTDQQRHHAARRQEGHRVDRVPARGAPPPTAPRAPSTTACCWHRLQPLHPADPRQGPAGVIAYRDIADTNAMIEAARNTKSAVVIGGGLLGPGGGQRPDEARHAGHRGPCDAHADGAPARRGGGQAAAEVTGRTRPALRDGRPDAGADRRGRTAARRGG